MFVWGEPRMDRFLTDAPSPLNHTAAQSPPGNSPSLVSNVLQSSACSTMSPSPFFGGTIPWTVIWIEGEDERVERDPSTLHVLPGENMPSGGQLQRRGLRPCLRRPASGVLQVHERNRRILIDCQRVIAADAQLVPGLHVSPVANPHGVGAWNSNLEPVSHGVARCVDSPGHSVPARPPRRAKRALGSFTVWRIVSSGFRP